MRPIVLLDGEYKHHALLEVMCGDHPCGVARNHDGSWSLTHEPVFPILAVLRLDDGSFVSTRELAIRIRRPSGRYLYQLTSERPEGNYAVKSTKE